MNSNSENGPGRFHVLKNRTCPELILRTRLYSSINLNMSKPFDEKSYWIHPSSIMMGLILIGIAMLFGALSFAYMYSRVDKGMDSVEVPWLFVFNTFILASGSLFIQLCRKYFDRQDAVRYLRFGILTAVVTAAFLMLQLIAWNQLLSNEIIPRSSGGYGFLFAISILHFAHVMAGIPFLLRLLLPVYTESRDGSEILFFQKKSNRRKLTHTAWYWHFIDIMWIYLVIFFIVNSFI